MEEMFDLKVMYVEKDNDIQEKTLKILDKYFNSIILEKSGEKAIESYKNLNPDIIISNIDLDDLSGLKMAKEIKALNMYQPIIIKTPSDNKEHLIEAFNICVDDYILDSLSEEVFLQKLEIIAKKTLKRKRNIEKREILQNILNYQSGIAFVTDFETISYTSQSFLDFFNLEKKEDFLHRHNSILDIFMKHDNYLFADDKENFLKKFSESKAINKVVLLLGKEFQPKAFHIHIDKIENSNLYIISLANITYMQQKNLEVSHKAYVDTLTGIYNRNKFEEYFLHEHNKYKRYKKPFSIAILDIDYFKKFNDTYGHLVGDEVLKMLAKEIVKNIRKCDLFARWGGEEFVLIAPETNINEARIFCDNLRKRVESLEHHEAGGITCSFGVAEISRDDSLSSILKKCDEALYYAKGNGRNRVEIYEAQTLEYESLN